MQRLSVLLVAALLVLAGCAAGSAPGGPADDTTDDPTTEPTTDPSDTTDGFETTNCTAIEGVSFYGLSGSAADHIWSPSSAVVGYSLDPDASVFLVAYVDGEVAGVEHETNAGTDYPVAVDGQPIAFDESLTGEHSVRVVVHKDVNGNGEFDAGTDHACTYDGTLVATDERAIDYDRFEEDDDKGSTDKPTKTASA
jgi:hypothetical protein